MTQLLRALTNNLQVRVTHAIQNCLDKFFHLINVLSRPFYASTTQILEKCWKNNLKPEIAFEEQTVYNVTYIIKVCVCRNVKTIHLTNFGKNPGKNVFT